MKKLWIIVKREYITRIRRRSFILGTLLAPMGLLAYIMIIAGLSSYQGGEELRVAIKDEGGVLGNVPDDKKVRYLLSNDKTLDALKQKVLDKSIDGVLYIPVLASPQARNVTVFYYSDNKLTPEQEKSMSRKIEKKIEDYKITALQIDRKNLESLETRVSIDPESVTGKEDDKNKYTTGVAMGLGFAMAFIMFFMVLMYGQMVMRSVMEEKTNRIVEVMMSSVKPFELMMGKIIGAGAVGFTQVLIWIVLNGAIMFIVPFFLHIDPTAMNDGMPNGAASTAQAEAMQSQIPQIIEELSRQNWWVMLLTFIFYFLGGYFIYASFFAAIGASMSDDLGEGQALTLPATLPIVLAFYLITFAGMRDPNSGLMVFASIFPLFSPIVMPFRMAFNPPMWQIATSVFILIVSTLACIWLAGRIYRVGILLYGKKVTFKELGKWIFYKT